MRAPDVPPDERDDEATRPNPATNLAGRAAPLPHDTTPQDAGQANAAELVRLVDRTNDAMLDEAAILAADLLDRLKEDGSVGLGVHRAHAGLPPAFALAGAIQIARLVPLVVERLAMQGMPVVATYFAAAAVGEHDGERGTWLLECLRQEEAA